MKCRRNTAQQATVTQTIVNAQMWFRHYHKLLVRDLFCSNNVQACVPFSVKTPQRKQGRIRTFSVDKQMKYREANESSDDEKGELSTCAFSNLSMMAQKIFILASACVTKNHFYAHFHRKTLSYTLMQRNMWAKASSAIVRSWSRDCSPSTTSTCLTIW
jgi:hypothetical protein